MPIHLDVPDIDYWKKQIKCQDACPVHTDARGYVRAIADGDDELAYLIARGPNPLASVCGRVCGAPCETACRRGDYDKPIAIRALKRYVCEKFGPEARADGGKTLIEFLIQAAAGRDSLTCAGKEELLPLLQSLMGGEVPKATGQSVGIIGSGPAGLAAAHDLALLGFSVTIYEMAPILAGMLALGIPEYRLPRDLVRAEVEVITTMGVKAVTDCCVGRDVTLPELRERHDAVVIAVGAKRSRQLPIPGAEAKGVFGGVEYLQDVALGNAPDMGKRIVVIGGGNVAYDIGRTVMRQISMDAARTAKRTEGVGDVYLCSLESLEEMPAEDIEIIEGEEEGIIRRNSVGPKEILVDDDGRVTGVLFRKCLRVFDADHRFSPLYDESDTFEIPCDRVLVAAGQSFDLSFLDAERDGVKLMPNGAISCIPETGATDAPDIFVAGDLAYGPKLLIHAVASGKAVARAIYERLTGRAITSQVVELHFPQAEYARERDYEKVERQAPANLSVTERLAGQDRVVELGFTPEQARCEAGRCLNCGVNTIFDGERCILCGGCADVCPELCLKIVPIEALQDCSISHADFQSKLNGYSPGEASAIIKDETICIRCALCAERCPTGAITMESFQFQENPLCLVD